MLKLINRLNPKTITTLTLLLFLMTDGAHAQKQKLSEGEAIRLAELLPAMIRGRLFA